MTDRLAFARCPHDHGWQHGDVLVIVEGYGSASSVRNKRTAETATVLTSALELIPASAIFRDEMMKAGVWHMSDGLSLANGEFTIIGETLAALALFEAMSEVSEESHCAGWLDGNGDMVWAWLKGGDIRCAEWVEHLRPTITALANASQLWWADYHYAVPLADWADEHGEAPGVEVARPSPEQVDASASEPGADGV